jgi:uncharacterized protein YndB with AHSA1/START domain
MSDRIEKKIELKAPVSRVWRALTEYREFGSGSESSWRARSCRGKPSRGNMTYPGYEHVKWEAVVQKIEHERLFSFTWAHPKSFDLAQYPPDYSNDPKTLVKFTLEKTTSGTLLTLTESGFKRSRLIGGGSLPQKRRRLDRADEKYQQSCHAKSIRGEACLPMFLPLRPSEMRRAWRW